MTLVQPALDDYPAAQVPDVPMWSENYAFMVNDAANGVAVASQLGRWPVDASIWREFFMIALPGERILYHKGFGRAATDLIASAAMFRIEVIEPGQRFRLIYDGCVAEDTRSQLLERGVTARPVEPLQFDLTFQGVAPVWDMSGHAKAAESIAGKMHVEQVGSVDGVISYRGETHRLQGAFGQRDHSRGIRVITNLHRHCWAQGWFPQSDITFNLYMMAVHGGAQPMSNASISSGGRRMSATVKSLQLMERPGQHATPYRIEIESELGPMTFEIARFVASMPAAFTSPYDKTPGVMPGFHAASSNEEAVIWRCNGEEGPGWSERSFNASPYPQ